MGYNNVNDVVPAAKTKTGRKPAVTLTQAQRAYAASLGLKGRRRK